MKILYNIMKLFTIFITVVLSIINMAINKPDTNKKRDYRPNTKYTNEYISQLEKEVIRCINEQDKEGLNNLFCKKVKDTKYLKKKWIMYLII